MISHFLPYAGCSSTCEAHLALSEGETDRENQGGHGSVCVPLYPPSRCQGQSIDPGVVPRRAHARWLRRALLLSGPRPTGAGCWRKRAACGNRDADGAVLSVLGGTGAILDRAIWD